MLGWHSIITHKGVRGKREGAIAKERRRETPGIGILRSTEKLEPTETVLADRMRIARYWGLCPT